PHPDPRWDKHWRLKAANHLRRVLRSKAAMDALAGGKGSGRRGRRGTPDKADIALAYVALKERLGKGRGNARAAAQVIAKKWNLALKTVKDAYTDQGAYAEQRLKTLLERYVGKHRGTLPRSDGSFADEYWTRAKLLAAIEADLLDQTKQRRV